MTTAVREGRPGERAKTWRQATPRGSITVVTGAISAVLLGVLAFYGGWLRRWMSDDGLIVLRTVRNLLAGNGPVFNAGERVEANTSTLWQYLIYAVAAVTDARLEMIALWLAIIFTTLALVIASWGTALLHRHNHALVLVPVGGLVYLALPPARDFATSGLEWGLSLLWIAVLWFLLMKWAHPAKPAGRHQSAPQVEKIVYFLAFWCGLSWLVRPELALYGGLAGLLIMVAATSWRMRGLILLAALPLPAAYQIFRMGYYGLLTPHTAVAKSAGEAAWADGWNYVRDLFDPYSLWLALALVVAMGGFSLWRFKSPEQPPLEATAASRSLWSKGPQLRTPSAAVALIIGAAVVHFLYILRVGGDFMHGRMLLLPLFAVLLPIMVLPIVDLLATSKTLDLVLIGGLIVLSGWAMSTVINSNDIDWDTAYEDDLGIVDERDFWTYATQRDQGDPPVLASDFHLAQVMNDYEETIERALEEDAALMSQYFSPDGEGSGEFSWTTTPRNEPGAAEDQSGLEYLGTTVYNLNLGMTSMSAPLELRVLDTVGLTTPLAARQPRDLDARVGHDKWLPREWQGADTDANLDDIPLWYGAEATATAREALQTPDLVNLFSTYREPMSVSRFFSNMGFALTEGRTLELSLDPAEVVDNKGPAEPTARIVWPSEFSPEPPR